MANVVIKDRSGKDITYTDVEKVALNNTDGEQVIFSKGEAVDGLQINLDFSNGNQDIEAPSGYLVKSATIVQPATLIPENIAEGVNVAGITGTHKGGAGGGGSLPQGVYYEISDIPTPTTFLQQWFYFNGNLYAFASTVEDCNTTNKCVHLYKWNGTSWQMVVGEIGSNNTLISGEKIELNGKLHIKGTNAEHYVLDSEENVTKLSNMGVGYAFSWNGTLYGVKYGVWYQYDEASNTWTSTTITDTNFMYAEPRFYDCNGTLYMFMYPNLYRINADNTYTELLKLTGFQKPHRVGNCIYYYDSLYTTLYKLNLETLEEITVGRGRRWGTMYGVVGASDYRITTTLEDGSGKYAVTLIAHEVS